MDWQQQEADGQRAPSWQGRRAIEDVQVRVMSSPVDSAATSPMDYRVHMLLSALMLLIALVLASMQ
jgi:hypothetical protein